VVQPQNSEGQYAVDGRRALFFVDCDDRPGLLSAEQRAARVGRTEAAFEVHRGAKAVALEVGKAAQEYAFESVQVACAGGFACGRRAALAGGDQFQELGLRLSEALRREPQRACARSRGKHAADEVSFLAPEVQRAAVVFG
jgi:hypothetical protein